MVPSSCCLLAQGLLVGLVATTAVHADPLLPEVNTAAVMGMGTGSGPGVPAAVQSALARLRAPAAARFAEQESKEGPDHFAKVDLRRKFKERLGYPLAERGGYKMSCYWLAWESEYASEPYDVDIYTRHGFRIGRFPRTYVFELKMEGSGILRDGRIINYDGKCSYGVGTCFTQLDPREHPMGKGGQQRALLPFKSVAVDPHFVPMGTPLYVPELRGLLLPNGTLHDGCVRADDTGGNIRRHELDFFVESYDNYKIIEDRLWNDHRVTPYIEEPRCDYLRTFDPVVDRKSEATDWLALHGQWPPLTRPTYQARSAPKAKLSARPRPAAEVKPSSAKKLRSHAPKHSR